MNLSRKDLLQGCKNIPEMEVLLNQAEKVLKTCQPNWSKFVSAPLREEAMRILMPLQELVFYSDGGYSNSERQRIGCRSIA